MPNGTGNTTKLADLLVRAGRNEVTAQQAREYMEQHPNISLVAIHAEHDLTTFREREISITGYILESGNEGLIRYAQGRIAADNSEDTVTELFRLIVAGDKYGVEDFLIGNRNIDLTAKREAHVGGNVKRSDVTPLEFAKIIHDSKPENLRDRDDLADIMRRLEERERTFDKDGVATLMAHSSPTKTTIVEGPATEITRK